MNVAETFTDIFKYYNLQMNAIKYAKCELRRNAFNDNQSRNCLTSLVDEQSVLLLGDANPWREQYETLKETLCVA